MKSTETKEASCTGKGKGTKKASKVAIVEGNNELELKHDVSKDISSPPKNQITAKLSSSETKEISTPTSSPKSAILKKFASVVTPGEEDKKSVGKTAKLATKKDTLALNKIGHSYITKILESKYFKLKYL